MRLSKAQGEAKAIRLAQAYLAARGHEGWTLQCSSARPDRKVPGKWSVVVECSPSGQPGDGPRVLVVDIAKEEVMSLEQALRGLPQTDEES